jgi:hypothetical protein
MSSSSERDAVRIGNALNDLGLIATGKALQEMRGFNGDTRLREILEESASIIFDMVAREEVSNPTVVPRSAEIKAALSRFRDLVRSIDWDDAECLSRLRTCARQALESLGFGLPD